MAKKTAGGISDVKAILNDPKFREVLLAGGQVRAGDIPLTNRPSGIQDEQLINLSPVGRVQAQNLLAQEAQTAQINRLADFKAALAGQRQVRGNVGQPLTADDITRISQRFMSPEARLQSEIGGIINRPTAPVGTPGTSFQPISVSPTEPSIAIGQRVLTDSTRTGGARQKVSNLLRQGILRLQQTATGGAVSGASGATATAVSPSLTPSSPLPEDFIARSLQDLKTKATKAIEGSTLEDQALKALGAVDPRLAKLNRKQRSEIAGFQFKNPFTNQLISIAKDGGFEVIS